MIALFFILFACKGGDKPGDTGRLPDTAPSDDSARIEDEDILRALIQASSPDASQIHDVLLEISHLGGLPVPTSSGGYLFVCECGEGDWSVAGVWNDWKGEPMTRNGDLLWAELDVPGQDDAGYKFTDGASAWNADPWARRFTYDENGEMSLVRASEAHLERWPEIAGQGLAARTIRVWVPRDGSFDHILYAHDSQNLFDPDGPWGGWHMQDSVPPRMLVVGIDNTTDRMDEYTHVEDILKGETMGGLGNEYADFVDQDLRPLMESNYGASTKVGILGSSLGGLISLHAAGRGEGRYTFAASMSGTLGWGSIGANNPTIIALYREAGHRSTAIYLDSGGGPACGSHGACADLDGDGTWDDLSLGDNYCETVQMRDTLTDIGYTFEQDLWHWNEPCAEHNEMAWAARVFRPLQLFAAM